MPTTEETQLQITAAVIRDKGGDFHHETICDSHKWFSKGFGHSRAG